ncbi:Transposase IS66 family protein [Marinomonas spartinae]|uniref:Transposase IS66 family protein n=1 Tax=Marinomonas spartinae TaxID=1792290 RepID=A0A1A8TPP5_9GAMM|nr:IS66 family transposase [Marinomonas spartinae]SBS34714.1 Transposase IS66 family protein [Marinomonas spartinae]
MTSSSENLSKIEQLRAQLDEQKAENQRQKERIAILEEVVRYLKIKRFAPTSEKTHPDQFLLFDEAELCTDPVLDAHEKQDEDQKKKNTSKPRGRKPLSSDLPREQIFLYLTDEEKMGAKSTFFAKVKEELDIVPAKVRVLEYIQEKAVFDTQDGQTMVTAPMPTKHPLPGSLGSTGLIAHVITSKYVDGLPLYRIEKMLSRYGGELSRATLANYVMKSAQVLQPLVNLLREHQNAGHIIAMDETRIQVLKEPGKSATSDKQMWVSLGGPPDERSVLFHYDPSRSQEVPITLLEGFKGYLQTDGYAGYNAACKQYGLTPVGCMDHARRKFIEAQAAQPKGKKAKVSKADTALGYMNKLYHIERQINELKEKTGYTPEQVVVYRQEHSVPLLDKLKIFLENNANKVPADSLTGLAITYMRNQWEKLVVYCTNGELRISNILAENAIRPFVVGRKAWLFADSSQGAKASAVCYSIVETAKLNGLEPYGYLHTVLTKLPYAKTVEQIESLLPWKLAKR